MAKLPDKQRSARLKTKKTNFSHSLTSLAVPTERNRIVGKDSKKEVPAVLFKAVLPKPNTSLIDRSEVQNLYKVCRCHRHKATKASRDESRSPDDAFKCHALRILLDVLTLFQPKAVLADLVEQLLGRTCQSFDVIFLQELL